VEDRDFEKIVCERLVIRRFKPSDAEAFAAYRSDPEVARYQSWEPPCSLTEARAMIHGLQSVVPGMAGEWYQFAVALASDDRLIGDFGLGMTSDGRQAELGFTFARAAQGQGYASEALVGLLDYAFSTLGLHRIFAITNVRNHRSQRLLERTGFRREGHAVQASWFKGEWTSEYLYAMLASEWSESTRTGLGRF
jgi:RimJ/RimL family protein N-acetyltransferase